MGPSRSRTRVVYCTLLVLLALPAAGAGAMELQTGVILGDGSGPRAITGLGLAPEAVLVRTLGAGTTGRLRTSTMTSGTKQLPLNQGLAVGLITSLDADGFTVGASLNGLGAVTHWIAFGGSDEGFAVGTYVGDGVLTSVDISDTSSSPDFQASYLILMSEDAIGAVQRFEEGMTGTTQLFGFTGPIFSNGEITDLTPTGFSVSSGNRTNEDGVSYHYLAWAEREGTEIDSYVGDGIAGDLLVPVAFLPKFVSVSRVNGGAQLRLRFATQDPDVSSFYNPSAETTDAIKSFTASGFTVGDSPDTNSAQTHFYVAFGLIPSAVPALSPGALSLVVLAIAGLVVGRRLLRG